MSVTYHCPRCAADVEYVAKRTGYCTDCHEESQLISQHRRHQLFLKRQNEAS